MRSSRQGAIPSDLGWLIDELDSFGTRLRSLEAPSGESLGNTVAKLTDLVTNIQATLTDFIENDVTTIVDQRVAIALASYMSGNVSIGGALFVNGRLTAPGVYALNVVTAGRPRTAVWVDSAGEVGHT